MVPVVGYGNTVQSIHAVLILNRAGFWRELQFFFNVTFNVGNRCKKIEGEKKDLKKCIW